MPELDTSTIGSSVEQGVETLTKNGWEGAVKLILTALVVLAVCLVVKAVVLRLLDRGLDRSHRIEKSFHTFLRSSVNILLWFLTILLVAEALGFNARSLLALLGIVGLAISLSIQGSLSNLAGGITILTTQPFKVGDYVDIGDTGGTIEEIGMVHTKLLTIDARRVVLPNSTVVAAKVVNYSSEPRRRVDLTVGASYDDDGPTVERVLLELMRAHPKVLDDPAPFARLSGYGDSAVEYTLRAWVENADYWTVYYDLLGQIKPAFEKAGLSMPYPQREITIRK